MIDLVVIGHGTYAKDVKKAVKFLGGELEGFHTLDCEKETEFEQYKTSLEVLFQKAGNNILVLADMMDALPYQAATQLAKELRTSKNIDVISGFNLGMVLQANAARSYVSNVHDLAILASDVGHKQIFDYDETNKDE
ncbi:MULTISPECIES: PTS sugar transporter subunit IIA [Terrabacteria group]|uniref:PTS sugar transporter subunit IIA n=1 Tax=Bacillati TaxID=1783272 RepID=UPI001939397A|nr:MULTISPECIES: hypothetical protein [Terrabacteria group]MBW9212038.1 hypothetical protein [Trueperella sp. zg.1013]QRG87154.1 hypothetical protein JOS54_02270 [Bulleidia sp. zg-1006]